MHRYGYTEECYFDYTFNPIVGASGQVEGILNVVQETTSRVLNERRTNLLRELAACATSATTEKGACDLIAVALSGDSKDIPFALLYSRPGDGSTTTLVFSTGLAPDNPLLAAWNSEPAQSTWPLDEAHRLQKPLLVKDLADRFGKLVTGCWPEPVSHAVILPATVPGHNGAELSLILGINPRKAFDAEYQRFLDLVIAHVTSILGSARAHEQLEIVLKSITDGFAVLDKNWKYTYFSDQAVKIVGKRAEDLLGKCIWEVFPDARGTPFYENYHRAVETGKAVHFEEYFEPLDAWLECHCYPSDAGLSVYFHEITSRKRAEIALVEANAQLADRATHLDALVNQRTQKLVETIGDLEAFSYSIAHDMRAPLRSLQGFSKILLKEFGPSLEPEAQDYLYRIAKSASRMDKLIQDVLNYSKLVRGDLSSEPVDLEALVKGILDTYPMFAVESADIQVEGILPTVLGNEAMLMQVLSNLMGNAVKFTRTGMKPQIQIWAEARTSMVRVLVRDNGIGIASDQHEKIFNIFQQVEKNDEGTGIGLAIVKKSVERMEGKVGVESSLGHGSTFWIELKPA
jgi:PAS domain S-box-containing protein